MLAFFATNPGLFQTDNAGGYVVLGVMLWIIAWLYTSYSD